MGTANCNSYAKNPTPYTMFPLCPKHHGIWDEANWLMQMKGTLKKKKVLLHLVGISSGSRAPVGVFVAPFRRHGHWKCTRPFPPKPCTIPLNHEDNTQLGLLSCGLIFTQLNHAGSSPPYCFSHDSEWCRLRGHIQALQWHFLPTTPFSGNIYYSYRGKGKGWKASASFWYRAFSLKGWMLAYLLD